jgi:hypothetical protein
MELVKHFFLSHPRRNIKHPEVVDWVTREFKKLTGKTFRDPDRAIRSLYDRGFLVKVEKGVYRYDPDNVKKKVLEDFTQKQKDEILKRDGDKCVICGRGAKDGVELHIDHIKPKNLGGKADIENGQTLCAQHNFIKKNLKQTETGKKMYIRLYELSKKEGNKVLLEFTREILKVYERFDINGHIEWKK